jgi:hypothetical protein
MATRVRAPLREPLLIRLLAFAQRFWTVVAGIGVVIGYFGLLAFAARMTVEPAGPFDGAHAGPMPFTITNTGFVTLRNFQPSLGFCRLVFKSVAGGKAPMALIGQPPDARSCSGPNARLVLKTQFVSEFERDERFQIDAADILAAHLQSREWDLRSGDISISIEFTTWYRPWSDLKEFRFVTKSDNDGRLSWIPVPLQARALE